MEDDGKPCTLGAGFIQPLAGGTAMAAKGRGTAWGFP